MGEASRGDDPNTPACTVAILSTSQVDPELRYVDTVGEHEHPEL